jgi:hypothetical protein
MRRRRRRYVVSSRPGFDHLASMRSPLAAAAQSSRGFAPVPLHRLSAPPLVQRFRRMASWQDGSGWRLLIHRGRVQTSFCSRSVPSCRYRKGDQWWLISLRCILVRPNHNGKRRRRKPAFRPIPVGGRQKSFTVDGEDRGRSIRWVLAWNARPASRDERAPPDRVLVKGGWRGHGHNQH